VGVALPDPGANLPSFARHSGSVRADGEELGGDLLATNVPDGGARFTLTLPAQPTRSEGVPVLD